MTALASRIVRDIDVRFLVRAAMAAPSPDNNQPWLFGYAGDRLAVWLDRRRALPSDVNGMFDLMAVGAAMENIAIAATQLGLQADVEYRLAGALGAGTQPVLAATIGFRPGGSRDPLLPHLLSRCTCRRLYRSEPPPPAALEAMSAAAGRFAGVDLGWATDLAALRRYAALIARTDLLRLAYRPFHEELFRQLRFTAAEAQASGDGLDVRTLELPPGGKLLLWALRWWPLMRWLHRLGLGWLLVVPSALAVWRSGALGILVADQADSKAFLQGGRALQRVWLEADRQRLAVQPLGSPAIFFAHQRLLGGRNLPAGHRRILPGLIERFEALAPWVSGRTLLMVFRVGWSKPASFRSLRRPVEAVYLPALGGDEPVFDDSRSSVVGRDGF